MTTFIKAVAEKGAEIQLIEFGYFGIPQAETAMDRGLVELRKECYFGIPQAETALDRGLADVNAELRKELTELRAENKRLTAAIEAISGTIAIYLAHQP
ncbi:MAG: hypothetical protein KBI08_13710 [Sphingobium sp.]|nr:hypothetical protein [Sphingobium sp.]